ncbi:MAG: hypothetical protein N2544_09535 [Burkholderiales bacterium]|nr:hypothetical protein [Burkholderiales bacterium]
MGARRATLVRTGACVDGVRAELEALYERARERVPDGFPAEETRELVEMRDAVSLAFVERLRDGIAAQTAIPAAHLSLDRFSIHGCGPVSLHDDKHNYPGVHFVIVVAHSGRLGVVDAKGRAASHATGEILLLDPHRRHALLPEGRTWREHPYERTHSPVHDERDQFLFVCFDVPRRLIGARFRLA